jgi:hypothetical protein
LHCSLRFLARNELSGLPVQILVLKSHFLVGDGEESFPPESGPFANDSLHELLPPAKAVIHALGYVHVPRPLVELPGVTAPSRRGGKTMDTLLRRQSSSPAIAASILEAGETHECSIVNSAALNYWASE